MVNNCILCKKIAEPLLRRAVHRFPKDEQRLSEWKRLTGIENVCNSTVLCSEHFKDDDYISNSNSKKRKLMLTAIPSLNLPLQIKAPPAIDTLTSNETDEIFQNKGTVSVPTKVGVEPVTEEKFFNVYEPASNEADNIFHNTKTVYLDEHKLSSIETHEFDIIQELDNLIDQVENTEWEGNPNRKLNGLCRNDFNSNEAWLIHRKQYFEMRRKIKNLKEQIRRRDIIIKKAKT